MNRVLLTGRLTAEPKMTFGKYPYCKICIAVQRDIRSLDGTYKVDFIIITLLGEIAKHFVAFCHKGDLIECEGSIVSNNTSHYVKVASYKSLYHSSTALGELDTPDSVINNDEDELN